MLLLGGCSTATAVDADSGARQGDGGGGAADAGPLPEADAAAGGADAATTPDASTEPYRHTIEVDGASSFSSAEEFATTTASYRAYVTWDDDRLYIGYQGDDVAAGDPGKWLMVYLDIDPSAGTGPATGERYNTQTPQFPAGFRPDFYLRHQSSGGVEDIKQWSGDSWQVTSAEVTSAVAGTTLEAAVELDDLGGPPSLGVVIFWINETQFVEAAYGGLFPDSFTDGYHETIPIARYLAIDFASPLPPNDPANRRP